MYLRPAEPIEVTSTSAELVPGLRGDPESTPNPNGYEELYTLVGPVPGGYLLQPVPVRVTFEEGEYVAEQRELDLHAFGDSAIEAVVNLAERIQEHYRRLVELGDRLSPKMKEQRRILQELLFRGDA